jgi:hypothetical protein
VPISIPESLVVTLPPILSPSSRTFVELTLVNWRQPWGSRRLDFVIREGSFNVLIDKISKFFIDKISKFFIDKISKFFIDMISKFCGCRQQLPIASTDPSTFIDNQIAPAGRIIFNDPFKFSINNWEPRSVESVLA